MAAVVLALVARLRERAHEGEPLAGADTWRLEENRWRAARWGMDAELAHLETGAATPARECLAELLDELAPVRGAARLRRGAARRRPPRRGQRRRPPARDRGRARRPARRRRWLADAYVPSADHVLAARGNEESHDGPLPSPRGDTSAAVLSALARAPHHLRPVPLPAAPTRSPTRTSSSRSTSATSSTTAGCPASTSAGSGRRRCSRSARRWRSASRPRCATRSASRPGAGARGDGPRAARRRRGRRGALLSRHVERDATLSRCSSSSCTAAPTSSRRPTRTPGRSRGSAARRRRRSSRSRPTSTAAAGRPHARAALRRRDGRARPDNTYGAYLDQIPAATLATVNLISLVRPPPPPARRDHRPPRALRDDVLDPQPALRGGPRPSVPHGGHRVLRRARRATPSRRSPPSISFRLARLRQEPALRRATSSGARARSSPSRGAGRATSWPPGSAAPPRCGPHSRPAPPHALSGIVDATGRRRRSRLTGAPRAAATQGGSPMRRLGGVMRSSLFIAVVLAILAWAAPAQAITNGVPDGNGASQRRRSRLAGASTPTAPGSTARARSSRRRCSSRPRTAPRTGSGSTVTFDPAYEAGDKVYTGHLPRRPAL